MTEAQGTSVPRAWTFNVLLDATAIIMIIIINNKPLLLVHRIPREKRILMYELI